MTIYVKPGRQKDGWLELIAEISGQNSETCMQCGACTGNCPMAADMDLSPRHLMHLAHLGLKKRLLAANTPWVCATCDACNVICPRGIDLPRVMEAVRLLRLRKDREYMPLDRLPIETLKMAPTILLVAGFRKLTG